jgi:hypothetical protein
MLLSSLTGSIPILVVAAMTSSDAPLDVPIREPRQGDNTYTSNPVNASTDYSHVPTMKPALQILLRFLSEDSRGRHH